MLFMEEHFQPVLPALQGAPRPLRRDGLRDVGRRGDAADAHGPVRHGRAGQRADGVAEAAARQARSRAATRPASRATAGARQMKMLRRLPKILRFIPGTAQDVRAYFLTLQYWLAGSEENVANMVHFLVDRYADGPRRALRGVAQAARAGRVSGGRRLSPAHGSSRMADTPLRRAAARRHRRQARHGRPAADALVPAGRQHRPLRRRDRRAGSARPARRSRPSPPGSTRARRSKPSSSTTAGRRSTRWSR